MIFGEKLHLERKKRHLSAQQLAVACGISRSYITLIETDRRLPGKRLIPIIANALGLKNNVVINWYLEHLREKLF